MVERELESERVLRADARRNRARILDVAHGAFATEGLGVPVDEIAQRAGVGVGTVYRHFPTKEALYSAILARRMEGLLEVAADIEDSSPPGDALFAFLRLVFERSATDMALAEAFQDAGVDVHSGSTADLKARMIAMFDRMLAEAQAAGTVRSDIESADLLALMAASCTAASRSGLTGADNSRVLNVVLDGLRPPAAAG